LIHSDRCAGPPLPGPGLAGGGGPFESRPREGGGAVLGLYGVAGGVWARAALRLKAANTSAEENRMVALMDSSTCDNGDLGARPTRDVPRVAPALDVSVCREPA